VTACTGYGDGRHRWRYGLSRLAGVPRYGCDGCSTYALPTGDGVGEDYTYLGASGEVVRDDGRTPWRVLVVMTAYAEVTVLAADAAEAREAARDHADELADLVARRMHDYGVEVTDPDVADAWRDPVDVAGEVVPG
jgi:hypothetical protein